MKDEKRGGVRKNAGAKLKYKEPTKTVSCRVPESKINEFKETIKKLLLSYLK